MKKVFLFMLLMVAASGILLMVQWIGYEKQSIASETIVADQTVEIDVRKHGFWVKQTFQSLPEKEKLNVRMPAAAVDIACSQKDTCEIGSQSGTIKISGEEFTLHYRLPAVSSSDSFLLQNWQASLENVRVAETTLMITDYTKRGGQWISSLEQISSKQMSVVDFYSFQGKTEMAPVYWQKKPLIKSRPFSTLTVFSAKPVRSLSKSFRVFLSGQEAIPQTVIIDPSAASQVLDGFALIKTENDLKKVHDQLADEYVSQHFVFTKEEKWLTSFVALALYNTTPDYPKAALMNKQIIENLTAAEQEKWKDNLLLLKGKEVNATKLDNLLASVKKEETSFFTANKKETDPVKTLVFSDKRPVTIEGEKVSLQMKKQEGRLFIPLKESAKALGFTVQEVSTKQWWIKKEIETYHFYLNEDRVVLNGHTYTVDNKSIQPLDGAVYIDKNWFQKIFLVEVQETEDQINLQSYGL